MLTVGQTQDYKRKQCMTIPMKVQLGTLLILHSFRIYDDSLLICT